jgi:hypothetical protein
MVAPGPAVSIRANGRRAPYSFGLRPRLPDREATGCEAGRVFVRPTCESIIGLPNPVSCPVRTPHEGLGM